MSREIRQPREDDYVIGESAPAPSGHDTLILEPTAGVLLEERSGGDASGVAPGSRGVGLGDLVYAIWANKGAAIGLILTAALIFIAVAAPLVAPHDPLRQNPSIRLSPPFFMDGWHPGYPLGTDAIGRDLLSRLIYGLRVSLLVGFSSVLLAIVIGVLIGLFAGYFGGWLDAILMRITDIQLGIPFIVLALAVLATLEPTPVVIVAVLSLSVWPIYARVIRAVVLAEKGADYVTAARALGASPMRIVFNYISRNILPPILILGTIDVATMIIWEALLGFIGIGIQPPTPSWGNIMADGKQYILTAWWLAVWPGVAIFITLFSLNLLGDSMQKYIDPRLR